MSARGCLSRRRLLRAAAGLLAASSAGAARAANDVDLELVLAVDASGSVDAHRFELQKQGYVAAFRNRQGLNAIRAQLSQAIAVTLMQWTRPRLHLHCVPWMTVKDGASANALPAAGEAPPAPPL